MPDFREFSNERLLDEARQERLNGAIRAAARQGDVAAIARLAGLGADAFACGRTERSALWEAIGARRLEASLFLAKQIDWDDPAARPWGASPFCQAVVVGWEEGALAFAPADGFANSAPQGSGCAFDAESALHMAAAEQNPRMIRLLLGLGLDPEASPEGFDAPLSQAAESGGSPECMRLLLDALPAGKRGGCRRHRAGNFRQPRAHQRGGRRDFGARSGFGAQ